MHRAAAGSRRRVLALDAVLVALAALVILVPVLELWDADVGVPFAYVRGNPGVYAFEPDAPFYQMLAKGGIDHAWFATNSSLGAPFGQELLDFPVSLDNLNLVGLKVLGTVTGSVGATVNVFYLLTFAAVAVSMLLVLRALGASRGVAFVVALLYTYLPYHFARGVPHLFLSAYWVVPLAGYLLLRVASARPPFTDERDDGTGWRVRVTTRSGVLWFLACVAIASSGAYYAAFTLLFLAILGFVDFIARRRTRVVASAGIAVAAIAVVGLFNVAPNLIYMAVHGQDTDVVRRNPAETEFEGLKLSQLVLPVEEHRVHALAELQAKSTKRTPTRSERGQQLGVIGAAGLVGLLVALLVAIRRDGRRPSARDETLVPEDPVPPPRDALSTMGVLTVAAIVMATISGFSLLVFGLGIRELRSWNRISVFIAFFAFVVVAYGLDWLRRRVPTGRWWTTPVVVVALAALLVVGILDQVSPAVIPDYAATKARWHSDDAFVAHVERALPSGASVYQLPYRYFPEAPKVGTLGPYDLVRPYLHSNAALRWGWGGMLGREADWQASTAVLPARQMLDRIAAVGFEGLVYDDGSTYHAGEPLPEDISAVLGTQPFISRDGELDFWDLRPYRRALRARVGADGLRRLRAEALADRSAPAH